MSYVVLARKYRPRSLEEVVGQEAIATTLRNAIRSDHVAHAYLFAGPRGVGKTSMARILAMGLNCKEGPTAEPCGKCPSCIRAFAGEDVDVLEIDGASNTGVENVRELRNNAAYSPSYSRYKIYIIDEVHMLSDAAFNALLKILEEPPAHVKFIFATTEPHKLPETIHSRCQRFDFRNISTADIVKRLEQISLAEGVKAEPAALGAIARRARGGMRDSQSLLDQLIAYDPEQVTMESLEVVLGRSLDEQVFQMLDIIAERAPGKALDLVDRLADEGENIVELLTQFQEQLRNLMVLLAAGSQEILRDLPADQTRKLDELSKRFALTDVLYMQTVMAEAGRRVRTSTERRTLAELAFVKLATMEQMSTLQEILSRLESLSVAGGAGGQKTSARSAATTRPRAGSAQDDPEPRSQTTAAMTGPGAEVAAVWDQVMGKLRPSVGAFLREGRIVDFADGVLTLVFGKGFDFHRQHVEETETRRKVEAAIGECLGRPVRLKVAADAVGAEPVGSDQEEAVADQSKDGPTPSGEEPKKSSQPKRTPAQTEELISRAGKDPHVRRAAELFRGRVVDVEP